MTFLLPYPWRQAGFPRPGQAMRLGRLLLREPGYAALWRRTHSWDAMERAGFLDDDFDRAQSRDLGSFDDFIDAICRWDTPLPSPDKCCPGTGPVTVLLATGSFAPLHAGHLAMLDAAEGVLLTQGIRPMASYLSLSHDGYVSSKDGGRGADYPAPLRLDLARDLLSQAPSRHGVSRFVDAWEALLPPGPVNFTTVIRRLEGYLSRHLNRPVHVVYVFGADNAGFVEAFPADEHRVRAICVGRPGHSPPNLRPGVLFAHLEHPESSTRQRRKTTPSRLEGVHPEGIYLLRNEGTFAFSHWVDRVDQELLSRAWSRFSSSVMATLSAAFEAAPPGTHRPVCFEQVDLQEQLSLLRQWQAQECLPVISLDACTAGQPGVVQWPSARYFRVADDQITPHAHGFRPAAAPPTRLPPVAMLVDDDTVTGHSLSRARERLSSMGVRIPVERILLQTGSRSLFDVVDLRDFLPGARDGGLVVQTPNAAVVRLPYLAPFVDLHNRARLPPGCSWTVSQAVWMAASRFFADLPVSLTVADMHPAQRAAFLAQGFDQDVSIQELCHYHAALLAGPGCPP